jgi:hypothetical protein
VVSRDGISIPECKPQPRNHERDQRGEPERQIALVSQQLTYLNKVHVFDLASPECASSD